VEPQCGFPPPRRSTGAIAKRRPRANREGKTCLLKRFRSEKIVVEKTLFAGILSNAFRAQAFDRYPRLAELKVCQLLPWRSMKKDSRQLALTASAPDHPNSTVVACPPGGQAEGMASVNTLMDLLKYRSPEIGVHCKRVAGYCTSMCRELGLTREKILEIEMAAVLHGLIKLDTSATSFEGEEPAPREKIGERLGASVRFQQRRSWSATIVNGMTDAACPTSSRERAT